MHLVSDPNGNRKKPWKVNGMHSVQIGYTHIWVESGFRTDLTSYPRRLGWVLLALLMVVPSALFIWIALAGALGVILMDPFTALRASVFHDKAYAARTVTRFEADAMYRALMVADGVIWWRVLMNYWGVRLFGWITWYGPRTLQRMP